MSNLNTSIVVRLIDNVTSPLRQIQNSFAGIQSQIAKATKGFEAFNKAKLSADKSFQTSANLSLAAQGVDNLSQKLQRLISLPLNISSDFEKAINRLGAIGQLSRDELAKASQAALKLGADTAFSSSQSAQALTELVQGGMSLNTALIAIGPTLDMAAASGMDLASAASITVRTLGGFGLAANQAARVSDVLAQAAVLSSTNVAELGEALKYVAPVAKNVSLNVEETTAMIGILANSGIVGSQAGTALRQSLIKLTDPSRESAKTLKYLGIATKDSQGNLIKFPDLLAKINTKFKELGLGSAQTGKIVSDVFGMEASSAIQILLDKINDNSLDKMTKQLSAATGATKTMAEQMLAGAAGAKEQLSGSLESLSITIGNTLLPILTKLFVRLTSITNTITDFVTRHQSLTKALMVGAGVLAVATAALSAFLSVGAGLFAFIGVFKLAVAGFATTASIVNGVLVPSFLSLAGAVTAALWPVALVVTGLAAIFVVVKYWKEISGYILGVSERLKNASAAAKIFVNVVWTIISILYPIAHLVRVIRDLASVFNYLSGPIGVVGRLLARIKNIIADFFGNFVDKSKAIAQSILLALVPINLVKSAIQTIGSIVDTISAKWDKFGALISNTVGKVSSIGGNAASFATQTISEVKGVFVPPTPQFYGTSNTQNILDNVGIQSIHKFRESQKKQPPQPVDVGGNINIRILGQNAVVEKMKMNDDRIILNAASGFNGAT